LYSEIGEQVRRNGLDSVSRRAVVRGRRKLWVTLPALFAVAKASGGGAAKPAIQAAQFLINAVISEPLVPRRPVGNLPPAGVRLAGGRLWRWIVSVDDSLGRVLEMLERLEREEQAGLRGVSRT
jgi:phytoene synthase